MKTTKANQSWNEQLEKLKDRFSALTSEINSRQKPVELSEINKNDDLQETPVSDRGVGGFNSDIK